MTVEMPRLRSDAQDNRDRILQAARRLFAERGLGIGMREIARAAEVGPATLYRRFPTKQAVIDEAFDVEMRACRQVVVEAYADPDAWNGFTMAVRGLIELNTRNRGFVDAFTAVRPAPGPLAEHRRELLSMLGGLALRAQQSGRLRRDFVIDDLVLVLRGARALGTDRERTKTSQTERFAGLMLDAFAR